MKPHLQCAEQQVSPSNLTKYCGFHAERLTYLIIITYETSFTLRGATGVTIQPHQILRSCRKTHLLNHHYIWNLIYIARSNRCHDPTSPNTAPVTQKDLHTKSSSHMKPHLHCAEQQVSPSNLTKYCACHAERLTYWVLITYETSFTMRGATGVTIQATKYCACHAERLTYLVLITYETSFTVRGATDLPVQHHQILRMPHKIALQNFIANVRKLMKRHFQCGADPSMIRPWNRQSATRPGKWGYFSSSPRPFSIVKYNISRPILHSNLHQILCLPRKVTLALQEVLHLPWKVSLELHQVLHLPRKVTLYPAPSTAPATKSDTWTSPNTAPVTQKDSLT